LTQEFDSVPKDPGGAFILKVWQSKNPIFLDVFTSDVKALPSFETSGAAGQMTGRRTHEELDLDEHVRRRICVLFSYQEEAWWGSYMRVSFGYAWIREGV